AATGRAAVRGQGASRRAVADDLLRAVPLARGRGLLHGTQPVTVGAVERLRFRSLPLGNERTAFPARARMHDSDRQQFRDFRCRGADRRIPGRGMRDGPVCSHRGAGRCEELLGARAPRCKAGLPRSRLLRGNASGSGRVMKFGIDRLLAEPDLRRPLEGQRVALVAHPASVTLDLTHSLDALIAAGIDVTAAFGPQHGIKGDKQDNMIETADEVDPRYGIPLFSLYGEVRRPTEQMIDAADVFLFDLQDLGCRIYTFCTTLLYLLEEAAKH